MKVAMTFLKSSLNLKVCVESFPAFEAKQSFCLHCNKRKNATSKPFTEEINHIPKNRRVVYIYVKFKWHKFFSVARMQISTHISCIIVQMELNDIYALRISHDLEQRTHLSCEIRSALLSQLISFGVGCTADCGLKDNCKMSPIVLHSKSFISNILKILALTRFWKLVLFLSLT